MEDQPNLVRYPDSGPSPSSFETGCSAPAINALLTAYCFGRASIEETSLVKGHLPECEVCRHEVERLTAAVRVLDTDRSLLETIMPHEAAGAFGISGKLAEAFGGHRRHVQLASVLYALLGAICLVMEVAYDYDQYIVSGTLSAIAVFFWLYGTTLTALWCDWKLTSKGNPFGLAVAMTVIVAAAVGTYAASFLVLPAHGVTHLTDAAAPARIAYQKDLIYHLAVMLFFCLPTLHFVLGLQRELAAGKHRGIFSLLTGDSHSVPPRGLKFPRVWLLVSIAITFFVYSMYAHFNLMSKLRTDGYYALFATLLQLRLLIFYILMVRCLYWYSGQLNEIKRECLIAERLDRTAASWL